MTALGRRFEAIHDRVTRAGFAMAAALLGMIALAFCYEVAARYLFNAPTSWANAIVSYLLCASIFLTVPELTRQHAHVSINLLADWLSPDALARLNRGIRIAATGACALATWISADATIDQFRGGYETISTWPIPKWWVSAFIPYGMFSSGLYFLRDLIHDERAAPAGVLAP